MGLSATAAGAMLVAAAAPAQAATADSGGTALSQSSGRVLSGTIAGTSLDTIAQAAGTEAKNYGGAPVSKDVTPDVSALNHALTVPLGQVKGSLTSAVPGLTLGGLVEQKVTARANGSSQGAASTAGLGLDLGTLTKGALNDLASLSLNLGAVTAKAAQSALPAATQTGTCTVAGLTLDLTSPAIAGIVGQVTTALSGLNTLEATLIGVINTAKASLPVPLPAGTLDISGIPTITSITDQLTKVSTPDGSISIDLTTGKVHVDLAKLLGTAGLDFCATPNTKPLAQLGTALANQIPQLISNLVDGAVKTATDLLVFCSGSQTTGCLKITVATVDVSGLLSTILGPTGTLTTGLKSAVKALTDAVGQVTGALGGLLTTLSDALSGVLDITTNLQATAGGTFQETALRIDLLSAAGGATPLAAGDPLVRLNLATATVGPSAAAPVTTPPTTPPTTTPGTPIKVDAGKAGPAGDDGGISPLWLGLVLIAGGAGGTLWLRRRATGH
ncbi:MAG: choice-of-anchor G family protein [Jatrophihabitans sp.]|uniref:choice-of-anchor G family protein n=1 Tax=Jatrophihabitans sp. TaxID=1932789 RepID=UPI003F7FC13A